jgi:hypothetical protein
MRSDELDYQRAVQAYLWAVPTVNAIEFWRALMDAGVSPIHPSLLVFDHPLAAAPADPAAGTKMIYAFTMLDLALTGPIVAEVPAGFQGNFWDFHHHGLQEIGSGASAQGGRFLLLAPGQDAAVAPPDTIVVRSGTRRVFGGGRCILKAGDSADEFIDLVAGIKLYPLRRADDPPPTRIVLNRDRPFVQDWPKGLRYFHYLAEELPIVSDDALDRTMHQMLAPLGIAPGRPFTPDDRMRRILCDAASAGAAMVTTTGFAARLHGRQVWSDRQWERNFFPTRPEADCGTAASDGDRAQGWYQVVGDGRYVFASTLKPGEAQWYSSTFHDRHGSCFDGSHSYRFTLPAGAPRRLRWSMTLYDDRDGSMIDTDRRWAEPSPRANLGTNGDGDGDGNGKTEVWFAPRAPGTAPANWIRTTPGQAFFATFRLYGPLDLVLDATWKLNDVEKVD